MDDCFCFHCALVDIEATASNKLIDVLINIIIHNSMANINYSYNVLLNTNKLHSIHFLVFIGIPPAYSLPDHTHQTPEDAEGLHSAVGFRDDAKPSLWVPQ